MNKLHLLRKMSSAILALIDDKKRIFFFLIACTVLLFSGEVHSAPEATAYYVSPNGNDNNPGTLAAPWRTIGRAAEPGVLKPGDTVYIRTGTYNEYIKPETSGAPSNPITYRNYPGEIPIIGSSSERYWRLQILDQSYLRFQGLTFQGYIGGAIQIRTIDEDIVGVEIVGNTFRDQTPQPGESSKTITVTPFTSGRVLSRIVIADNQFFNMDTFNAPVIQFDGEVIDSRITGNQLSVSTNIGIGIAGRPSKGQPRNLLIKNNEVSGHGSPGKSTAGIYLDGAGSNIVVEENIIYDGLQGIKVDLEPEAATLITERIIVRRNILYNNSQINLKMGAGETCSKSGMLRESVVVHNTIYSDINNITNFRFDCATDLRWKNNIFVHSGPTDGYQYQLLEEEANPSTWRGDHNLFLNQSGEENHYRWFEQRFETLTAFQTAITQDTNSLQGNPLFTDAANFDFTLTTNSIARNNGGSLTTTTAAGSGTAVPVAEAWYFSDGLGWQPGDMVQIGSNPPVEVVGVSAQSNQIIVSQSISWQAQDAVSYAYTDNAPDIGAFEFTPVFSFFGVPNDGQIRLTWKVNDTIDAATTWHIDYSGPAGAQPSPISALPSETRTYVLTGLTNYISYEITLSAIKDGEVVLTKTIQAMPTDIFSYLPFVHNK